MHWSNIINNENLKQLTRWYNKCSTFSIKSAKWCANNFLVLNSALGSGANPVGKNTKATNIVTGGTLQLNITIPSQPALSNDTPLNITWTYTKTLDSAPDTIYVTNLRNIDPFINQPIENNIPITINGTHPSTPANLYYDYTSSLNTNNENLITSITTDNNTSGTINNFTLTIPTIWTITTETTEPTFYGQLRYDIRNRFQNSNYITKLYLNYNQWQENNLITIQIPQTLNSSTLQNINPGDSFQGDNYGTLTSSGIAAFGHILNNITFLPLTGLYQEYNGTIDIDFVINYPLFLVQNTNPDPSIDFVTEVTSFIQRAKILHVKPHMKHGRRFALYGGEFDGASSNTQNMSIFGVKNFTIPTPTAEGQVLRPVITTAADSSYLSDWTYPSVSSNQKGFKILQMAVGGATQGGLITTADLTDNYQHDLQVNPGTATTSISNIYVGAVVSGVDDVAQNVQNQTNSTVSVPKNNPLVDQYLANVADLKCYEVIGGDDSIECEVVTNMDFPIHRNNLNSAVSVVSTTGTAAVSLQPLDQHNDILFSGQLPMGLATSASGADIIYPTYPNANILPRNKMFAVNPAYQNYIKMMKPLQHSFLTMIPIVESAGVVNQQANFMFEQEVYVEFNFDDGWSDNNEDLVYPSFVPMLRQTGVNASSVTYNWFLH